MWLAVILVEGKRCKGQGIKALVVLQRAVKERLMRCFCHVGALAWKCAKLHTGPNKYNPEVHSLIQLMNLTADQIHALLAASSVHDAGIEAVCQDRLSILKEIRQVDIAAVQTHAFLLPRQQEKVCCPLDPLPCQFPIYMPTTLLTVFIHTSSNGLGMTS